MAIKNQKDLEKFVMDKLEPPVETNAQGMQDGALQAVINRAKAASRAALNKRIVDTRV